AEEPSGKAALGWMALAGLLSVTLCAAELVPALSVAAASGRRAGAASSMLFTHWALHPLRLIELAVPAIVPDPIRYRVVGELFHDGSALWSSSVFAGALALALALASLLDERRGIRAWLAVALLALWLSLGSHGGLLPLVAKLVPPLGRLRYPEKYLALFWVALAPLVALGADRARAWPRAPLSLFAAGVAFAAAGAAMSVEAVAQPLWQSLGGRPDAAVASVFAGALGRGLLQSAAALVGGGLVLWIGRRRSALAPLLPLLVFAELLSGNGGLLPLVPRSALSEAAPFVDAVKAEATSQPPRAAPIASPRLTSTVTLGDGAPWVRGMVEAMRPDVSSLFGIDSLGTNLPGTSLRYLSLFGPRAARTTDWGGRFSACARARPSQAPPRPGERTLVSDTELAQTLGAVPCRPRAYLAGADPVPDLAAALAAMASGLPEERVVWEGGPALGPAAGEVAWRRDEPERIALDVSTAAPTALVVTDELAPGWTARLDGEPAKLFATDVVARGLALPAGRHAVEFEYRAPGLTLGLALSLLAAAAALALLTVGRGRGAGRATAAPRSPPPPAA
ncbi:MAG: hypothetical protein ACYCWW_21370, partial [Deltaproteobacteria bacterium]